LTRDASLPILQFMEKQLSGLGDVLKRNRLQQKDVAVALGVSRMTVWQWVHGRAVPTGENLLALAAYLKGFEPTIEPKDLVESAA
jgi:transcriptional regulator with XRE-family HTH domain